MVGQFGKASNTSDGTAAIETGNATAVGNDSETGIGQTIDPSGLVVNTQAAAVVNAGIGIANSRRQRRGGQHLGQQRQRRPGAPRSATTTAVAPTIIAGTLVASNNGEASNTSDGLATITTGDAAATGNESSTNIRQEANGAIDGGGAILNTQVASVANLGLGVANSGGNGAVGNDVRQRRRASSRTPTSSSDNAAGAPTLVAGIVTASNDGTASNASDGEANITTGNASGAGNRSQTVVPRTPNGDIDGLGARDQHADRPRRQRRRRASANSGGNGAVGNASDNDCPTSTRTPRSPPTTAAPPR